MQDGTAQRPGSNDETGDHRFIGHAIVFSAFTALSRCLGLIRDILLVKIFSDSVVASAFAAAFAVPNLFRRLFGEGALSASFVPEYAQRLKHDPDQADALASVTVAVLVLITSLITVLGEVLVAVLLLVLPHDAERVLFLRLTMIMLPFMPLVCAAAILGGVLQTHGRFGPSAAAPVVLNLCIIVTATIAIASSTTDPARAATGVAISVIVAGLLQVAWAALALRKHVKWTRAVRIAAEPGMRMLKRFVPAVIGLGTLQINALLDMMIAMWPILVGPMIFGLVYPLDQSSNGLLFFAQRLYQFPLGIFGIAIATAVFPALSRYADDPAAFTSTLRRGVMLSLFIAIPASVGLVLVRSDFVAAIYPSYPPESLRRSSLILLGYAPALWAYALNHVWTRAFYARGDTVTPMRVALAMVGLNLVLNVILIWPLGEAGLAWSTAVAAVTQCVVLGHLAHRRHDAATLDQTVIRAIMRTVGASVLVVAVVLLVQWLLPDAPGWRMAAIRLGASACAGAITFGLASAAMRAPELRWLLTRRADD